MKYKIVEIQEHDEELFERCLRDSLPYLSTNLGGTAEDSRDGYRAKIKTIVDRHFEFKNHYVVAVQREDGKLMSYSTIRVDGDTVKLGVLLWANDEKGSRAWIADYIKGGAISEMVKGYGATKWEASVVGKGMIRFLTELGFKSKTVGTQHIIYNDISEDSNEAK